MSEQRDRLTRIETRLYGIRDRIAVSKVLMTRDPASAALWTHIEQLAELVHEILRELKNVAEVRT